MASLRELQRSFAAALNDPAAACAVYPPANLAVYRNNASIHFRESLERRFPVVRRRVGDDYFRQLAAQYRAAHPSRSGDLHDYGREFAGFLDRQLLGTEYAWLADLARLEWLRAESAVAAEAPRLGSEALARAAPGDLEHLVFGLQPSLRLFSSSFPVYSVWLANQAENAPPVDQSTGPETGMTHRRGDLVEIRLLPAAHFLFIQALHAGHPLGDAMTRAGLDSPALTDALATIFSAGLVSSL